MSFTVRHDYERKVLFVANCGAGATMDEDALPRKILAGELHYAKLWLVCVALRGTSWDKMPFEQRELAFQAKDAASACLSNLLNSPTYRSVCSYFRPHVYSSADGLQGCSSLRCARQSRDGCLLWALPAEDGQSVSRRAGPGRDYYASRAAGGATL